MEKKLPGASKKSNSSLRRTRRGGSGVYHGSVASKVSNPFYTTHLVARRNDDRSCNSKGRLRPKRHQPCALYGIKKEKHEIDDGGE